MSSLTSKAWWKAVFLRMIKTMAETAIAYIGSAAVLSEINWPTAISAVIVSAIVCLLMNIQGLPETEDTDIAYTLYADTEDGKQQEFTLEIVPKFEEE